MIGWFDASAGASGDMLLGTLLDAGVPVEVPGAALAAVGRAGGYGPITIEPAPVTRHGLAGTLAQVRVPADPQPARHLPEILALLARADLPEPVRAAAGATFDLLAAAEAAVHRSAPDEVHFHEVGALDAIADIVGAAAGVHWLRTVRGLTRLTVGPIEVGSAGPAVASAHGRIPVPAPAVLELARRAGLVVTGALPYEACTPTGMALLATLTDAQGPLPALRPDTMGTGAGQRDPDQAANVLRLVLGTPAVVVAAAGTDPAPGEPRPEPAVLLECNIDDQDPRLWPGILAHLLRAGVADAWLSPIVMKKGRPAYTLHVLCRPEQAGAAGRIVFEHSATIGIRQTPTTKLPLTRREDTVLVDGQPIAVKLALLGDQVVNVAVEWDDVAAAALALDLPAKVVLARANALAAARYRNGAGYPD